MPPCLAPIESVGIYHFYPGAPVLIGLPGPGLPPRLAEARCRLVALHREQLEDPAILRAAKTAGLEVVARLGPGRPPPGLDALRVELAEGATVPGWIAELRDSGIWIEVGLLLDPQGSVAVLETRLCQLRSQLGALTPLHLMSGTPDGRPEDDRRLVRARWLAIRAGLELVYVVGPESTESTFCPGCETCLVERRDGHLVSSAMRDSACPRCGLTIPGRWAPRRLGPRRAERAPLEQPLDVTAW